MDWYFVAYTHSYLACYRIARILYSKRFTISIHSCVPGCLVPLDLEWRKSILEDDGPGRNKLRLFCAGFWFHSHLSHTASRYMKGSLELLVAWTDMPIASYHPLTCLRDCYAGHNIRILWIPEVLVSINDPEAVQRRWVEDSMPWGR